MPRVFRVMLAGIDGKPLVGSERKMLGVRIGAPPVGDIALADASVYPTTGGLSVGPDWKALPHFLIPRRLRSLAPSATGKNDNSRCFRYGAGPFENTRFAIGLMLRVDTAAHGLVEPESIMLIEEFQRYLADTRGGWVIDES